MPISGAGINAAATLTLFAMLGFESAMAAGDRVKECGAQRAARDHDRGADRGADLSARLLGGDPAAAAGRLADVELALRDLLLDLRRSGAGPASSAVFVAIAAFGALNGFILVQAEMPLALAREGLLPAWFARFNRDEIPYRIHIISSGLATLLVLANYSRGLADLFQFMMLVTTSVSIIFYLACSARRAKLARARRIAGSPAFVLIAVAGLAYSAWAFYGAGIEASLWSLA